MKRILIRRIILSVSIFLLFLLIFVIYVNRRGGPNYKEDLAQLLPENIPLYLSLRDLSGIIDELEQSPAINRAIISGKLQLALLISKDWRKIDQKKHKVERTIHINLGLEFIKKWLGNHVILALLPVEELERPGVILVSKTGIGFEEKLAEFVAQNLPGLKLYTTKHQNHIINMFRAEKARRSFSYTRFGQVVIISLRSPDIIYLQKIIDMKEAKSKQTLLENSLFRQIFQGREKERGIIGYIDPLPAVDQLRQVLVKKGKKISDQEPAWMNQLQALRSGALKVFLKNGLRIEMLLIRELKKEELGTASSSFTLSPEAFDAFSKSVCNLYINSESMLFLDKILADNIEDKEMSTFLGSWRPVAGKIFFRDHYLAVINLIPGALFPLPSLIWQPAIKKN